MNPCCRRLGGLAVGAIALLTAQPLNRLAAQHFSIGPQIAFGDYKEVSPNLHYRGSGIAAKAAFQWKKFSGDVVVSKLTYKPASDGTATTEFDASEVNARLRYYIAGPISGELGIVNRNSDPELEAQSVGAVTVGARMAHLLGPGVHMNLNAGLLVGSTFSGGGTTGAVGAVGAAVGVAERSLERRPSPTELIALTW